MPTEVKLGKEGEPFKFTQCVNKVTVEEASVITNQITVVEDFIRNQTGR
jgi:signal recognition particle receptor subunit beta